MSSTSEGRKYFPIFYECSQWFIFLQDIEIALLVTYFNQYHVKYICDHQILTVSENKLEEATRSLCKYSKTMGVQSFHSEKEQLLMLPQMLYETIFKKTHHPLIGKFELIWLPQHYQSLHIQYYSLNGMEVLQLSRRFCNFLKHLIVTFFPIKVKDSYLQFLLDHLNSSTKCLTSANKTGIR